MRIALTGLLILLAEPVGLGHDSVSPLSRQVIHFSIGKTTALNALLWLGSDEQICIGFEFMDKDLNQEVQLEVEQTTIGETVTKILGSSKNYELSDSNGVILIRKRGVKPPAWLNHRIPKFQFPRMELFHAASILWMTLETDLDPSQRGFLGDSPVTDPVDEVGPFGETGQTVRQLLIRISTGSRGASWCPTPHGVQTSFPASINRFWTFFSYSGQKGKRPE